VQILLVEPQYYTRYPPLPLLRLGSYHEAEGDNVELVYGTELPTKKPDKIYITSLFTYAWKPVHDCVGFFSKKYSNKIIEVGGIYASLLEDRVKELGVSVHTGRKKEVEGFLPKYELLKSRWNGWDTSILFSSRGCVNSCRFCAVPRLEPVFECFRTIKGLIEAKHPKIILWDNNFLASKYKNEILEELIEFDKEVDFNQGLDAAFIDERTVNILKQLKIKLFRLAYDSPKSRASVLNAIEIFKANEISGRKILVYTLYNYNDSPEIFFDRVKELLTAGVVVYPMRYEPAGALKKNNHVGKNWNTDQLELLARARRVIGFGGAFPPYEGLVNKLSRARNFDEAFSLRPARRKRPA